MPSPKNGTNALREQIAKSAKYPEAALEAKTQGVVLVKFNVMANGYLENIRVDQKLGNGLDELALNQIKKSGPWNPGKIKNASVNTSYSIPVALALD